MKHVIVLGAQVPFVAGGAELLNRSLIREINKMDGVRAEEVRLPFKWYPEGQILNDIMAWRLLDLSEANGKKIDLAIVTKFPTYALQHENKVLWLVHQHRTLYDLENTEFDCWNLGHECRLVREKIRILDRRFFSECRCHYTISQNVSERLKKFSGFESQPLFPPTNLADKIVSGKYGEKIVYIGRLVKNKRPDLLIHAARHVKRAKISIIGQGGQEDYNRLANLINELGIGDRCEILGFLPQDDLLHYLSEARAVFYAPVDEDYGFVTIEAFLAQKPVVTCDDSGEVTKFVEQTRSGFISDNDPKYIAHHLSEIYSMDDKKLKEMTTSGYELARKIKWEYILQKLVLENLK